MIGISYREGTLRFQVQQEWIHEQIVEEGLMREARLLQPSVGILDMWERLSGPPVIHVQEPYLINAWLNAVLRGQSLVCICTDL